MDVNELFFNRDCYWALFFLKFSKTSVVRMVIGLGTGFLDFSSNILFKVSIWEQQMSDHKNRAKHCSGKCRGCAGQANTGYRYSLRYTLKHKTTKTGLCENLEGNVFGFSIHHAANLTHTSQEKIFEICWIKVLQRYCKQASKYGNCDGAIA